MRLTESEKTKFPCPAENRVDKVTTLPAMLQRKWLSRADFLCRIMDGGDGLPGNKSQKGIGWCQNP